jgi:general secretion pathway protein D
MNRVCSAAIPKSAFFVLPALVLLVALLGLSSVSLHAESANTFYKRGVAAEQREDYDTAFTNFQQAAAKSPQDLRYREALYRVRISASGMHLTKGRRLIVSGDLPGAMAEFLRAQEIDPGNEAAHQEVVRLQALQGQGAQPSPEVTPEMASKQDEIESMGAPMVLKPVSNEPLTLHMTEDAKVVYQAVGRAAGVNVLFDPDFNSKRITVDLTNVNLADALRIVGTMSNTFWRPVTSNTIFVAQNTRAKRTELDEQAVQTFYLTNAWQQNDLNDVQTALRNVLTNIKVYGVASQNALVVRGTPDELLLAQKLINDLDKARPEVVVDIAVMEVSKNWERNLGISWPASATVALNKQSTSSNSGSGTDSGSGNNTNNLTLYNLSHLNSNDVAVTVGAATANLLLTDSNTKILQNPRLRATDAQKATMKIGERIPIATGSYQTGAATALVSSLVNTQFQYLDVGVNIEITPTVHFDRDVTLKMKIEVTAQSGSSTISGVTEPIIAQKSTEEVVRLREGEANILSGILNQQEQVSWSGIPGLSSIPILKYLFGSRDHTKTDDEVVFLMVPHIVRSQDLSPLNLRTIDTGVGQAIELRHIAMEGRGANSPAQIQPVTSNSVVGTVPGQSATTAAPNAMAQMKQAAQGGALSSPVPQTNLGAAAQTPAAAQNQPPPPPPPVAAPPAQPADGTGGAAKVNFLMNPPGAVAAGSTFEVPVVISGASDIGSIPLQIQYDASKLSLVNVVGGDFLSRDQQAVALVHRDDGPGNITINASRPPGAPGVNGAGVVCVLSFEAKAAGDSKVEITRPAALNSKQEPVLAQGTSINVSVK